MSFLQTENESEKGTIQIRVFENRQIQSVWNDEQPFLPAADGKGYKTK